MAGGGMPKRGDVMKGIMKGVLSAVKEATELSTEQLNVNVRAFRERQASLRRASTDARRREELIAKKLGHGLPKRGDVNKRIGKELVKTHFKKLIKVVQNRNTCEVMELFVGKLIPSKGHQLHSEMSMHSSRADSPLPVALATASSAVSSLAADSFLQASLFPTKKEVVAKQWPKVDMSRALVHKRSVLYEEQKGKWAVMGGVSDEAASVVIPLITPSLRIATPL